MKIAYIVNARMPTEKAHGYQITRMCVAFTEKGAEVELIVPARKNTITEDVFSYYGLPRVFSMRVVGSLFLDTIADFVPFLGFRFRSLFFLARLSLLRLPKDTVIYSRDPEVVWLFGVRGYSAVYDAHRFPERREAFFLFLIRHARVVVANSGGTARAFEKRGISRVLVAHNAVDVSAFIGLPERKILRDDLGLPQEKKIAMYVGHLYAWKGIDIVFDAAEKLKSRSDVVFLFVGGTERDVAKYKHISQERALSNVRILGHQKKETVPKFLSTADILLLPNLATTNESSMYTSPIKMFEYMASGVPIIASNLPSLREVLNTQNALLVPPGDADAIAVAISTLLEDPAQAHTLSSQAHADVASHTWENRAESIIVCLQEASV